MVEKFKAEVWNFSGAVLRRYESRGPRLLTFTFYGICQGCRPSGCHAMASSDFGRSVNPISTRGDRLCLPNYYWHPRIFKPSDGPEYHIYYKESCEIIRHLLVEKKTILSYGTLRMFLGTKLKCSASV